VSKTKSESDDLAPQNHQPDGPISLHCFLALPFLHNLSFAKVSTGEIGDGASEWRHWFARLIGSRDFRKNQFPFALDYSYFFLPRARQLLFPEMASSEEVSDELGESLIGHDFAPNKTRQALPLDTKSKYAGAALRLTSRHALVGKSLEIEHDSGKTAFVIEWADAILFPQHIGALLLKVSVRGATDLHQAAAFLRCIRKNRSRHRLSIPVPNLRVLETNQVLPWAELTDGMIRPFRSTRDADACLVEETLSTTYKCVVVAEFAMDDPGAASGQFQDELERRTFALATGHAPNSAAGVFSRDGMQRLRSSSLAMWENSRILGYDQSVTIGLLAGTGPSKAVLRSSSRRTIENTEWTYAVAHVLAVVQYARIHLLAHEYSRVSLQTSRAIDEISDFERDYVRFRRLLWCPAVTSAPVGSPIYALSRSSMDLQEHHDLLHRDVEMIRDYLTTERESRETRASARTATALEILTFIGAPVGLVLSVVQTGAWNSISAMIDRYYGGVWQFVGITAVAFAALYGVLRLSRRTRDDD
jgi:hypothetical protein